MRKTSLALVTAAVLASAVACSSSSSTGSSASPTPSPTATGDVYWSYSGDTGPNNWANLSTAYATCGNGPEQSPIDITTTMTTKGTTNPTVKYAGTDAIVVNTGHTFDLVSEGKNSIVDNGTTYELEQLHFHNPSENSLNGKSFPAEFHFVHESADGKAAVLAVFAQVGAENAAWEPYLDNLTEDTGETDTKSVNINWGKLPPPIKSTIQFAGSLTTPPCTGGVSWNVIPEPISLSQAQIDKMVAAYPNNVRPIQPLNGRPLTQDPK